MTELLVAVYAQIDNRASQIEGRGRQRVEASPASIQFGIGVRATHGREGWSQMGSDMAAAAEGGGAVPE